MRKKSVVQPPRQFGRKLKKCKTFLGAASKNSIAVQNRIAVKKGGCIIKTLQVPLSSFGK